MGSLWLNNLMYDVLPKLAFEIGKLQSFHNYQCLIDNEKLICIIYVLVMHYYLYYLY